MKLRHLLMQRFWSSARWPTYCCQTLSTTNNVTACLETQLHHEFLLIPSYTWTLILGTQHFSGIHAKSIWNEWTATSFIDQCDRSA
ncbi:hypothetical protein PROAA_140009 [Candidatus Propionivibrio aalborgensis]|uniref:Uncharacterized protein n=1 Tax=Candidatus Propionivibrio aalborgensis TaxID=1860101 RepID=A0A1A8XKN7_9RHOO|nr:hypothetical protein PROAA_140009 [Candidatus Propionivibrio aalborgensis]